MRGQEPGTAGSRAPDDAARSLHGHGVGVAGRDRSVGLVEPGQVRGQAVVGEWDVHCAHPQPERPHAQPVLDPVRVPREVGDIGERLRSMTSARQVCEDLLEEALAGGGSDNISLIVCRALPQGA